jgi:hypothetical protein
MTPRVGRYVKLTGAKLEARKAQQRRYYANHRKKILARTRRWQAVHRKEMAATQADYRARNKEKDAASVRQWKLKHPGYFRKNMLKKKYNLSLAEFQAMVKRQKGKCCICHQRPRSVLHVDHNHTTGSVRGLLCSGCNRGLGCFQDRPALLKKAAKYLEKHCK